MECSFIRDTLDIEPRLSSDGIGLAPPNRGSSHHKYKTSEGHVQNFPSPTFFRWNIQLHSKEDRPSLPWQGFFIRLRSRRTCPSSKHGIPRPYPAIAPLQRGNSLLRAGGCFDGVVASPDFLDSAGKERCEVSILERVAFESSAFCFVGSTSHWLTSTKYSQDFVLDRMMGNLVLYSFMFLRITVSIWVVLSDVALPNDLLTLQTQEGRTSSKVDSN